MILTSVGRHSVNLTVSNTLPKSIGERFTGVEMVSSSFRLFGNPYVGTGKS